MTYDVYVDIYVQVYRYRCIYIQYIDVDIYVDIYVQVYNIHICTFKPPSTLVKNPTDYTLNFCKYTDQCKQVSVYEHKYPSLYLI